VLVDVEDPGDVLTDDSQAQQLDAAEQQDDDEQRRPTRSRLVREEARVQSPAEHGKAEHDDREPEPSDELDRHRGERRDPIECEAEHLAQGVLRLAGRSDASRWY
jgi:hypothetical protein